ncbi:MAG: RNA polymerase factor sigma-54 [Gammaproteobacteria bacterium]|nr:RNA polymerase factor sigma-54 [Gammaproteobacteria bacterium]
MSPELELQLNHQLKLNPQLQQSLKLLQLSQLELAQEIQNQLETNPLLSAEEADLNEQFNSAEQVTANGTASTNNYSEDESNYWEAIPDSGDLKEKLEFQLQLHSLSRLDLEIGYYIIENLNEQGFLTVSPQEICDSVKRDTQAQIEPEEVTAMIHLIQTFEPAGCASADLQEFMLFQLLNKDSNLAFDEQTKALLTQLLTEHFHLLIEQQYQKLESKLTLDASHVKTLIGQLQLFQQRPNDYAAEKVDNYIRPDIKVFRTGNHWQAQVTQSQLPKISINKDYASLMEQVGNDEDKKFIKDKALQAQQFLQSLEARKSTLQRVADYLIKTQAKFFELGEQALKPLKLNDVADELELHESTISRATSNKFCQTPNGLIKLKSLFSNAINTNNGGEWSQAAVKHRIQQLIQAEPSRKPLSDNSIVALLAKQGISIARRTVAKYRDALQIPSASKRKQLSALRQTN